MIIAHVAAPAAYGGLERVVRGLAIGQARRGHEVHVINVFDDSEAKHPIETSGVDKLTSHIVEIPRWRYWREPAAVADICRTARAAVIHTHGYRPDVLDHRVADRLGARSVTTVHGFLAGSLKTRVFERLQVRAFRDMDAVVAVSRQQYDFLRARGIPSEILHVVRNAWAGALSVSLSRDEARQQLGLGTNDVCVGWMGRLSHEKGPDVMVAAAATLAKRGIVTVMMGGGRESESVRALSSRLDLGDRLRLPGAIPDAGRLLAAFDVFALSSRTEGTPIALLEAVAAGIPVVATNVGGVGDVVSDTEGTLVVSEHPAALAAAIVGVLDHPEPTAAKVAAARARLSREFGLEPWLDSYERIYQGHAP